MQKFFCAALALALLLSASALAETDIAALRAANESVNVAEVYQKYVQRVQFYDASTGEATDSFTFCHEYDPDLGALYTLFYDNGDVEFFGHGGGGGYSAASEAAYLSAFVGTAYEEQMLYYGGGNLGEFATADALESETLGDDGFLHLTLTGVIGEDNESYGAENAGKTLVCDYRVDPETLVIVESDVYVLEGGEKQLCMTTRTELGAQAPELPFDVEALRADAEQREVHVIMDPGTDEEFDFVFTAPSYAPMMLYTPEGYAFYADETMLMPYEGTPRDEQGNYPDSVTVYCGPAAQ